MGKRRATFIAPLALAAVCASVAGAACGGDETAAPAPIVAVTVLDTGRTPRATMRYPSEPTPAIKMSLSLRLAMKMKMPGSPVPPVTMPGLRLLLDVTSAAAGDNVKYQFTVADADLTSTDNAHPSLLAEMRKGIDALVGTSGQVTVDARGMHSELAFAPPDGIGQELASFVNGAKLAIGQMVVPLPAEPVGPGAKWEAVQLISQDGIRVREKTYYELVALDGPRALLRTQSVQSADRQRAALPDLPDGVTAELESLRGSGAGEIEIDLRRLVPGNLREEAEVDLSFTLRQGQTERTMPLTHSSGVEIQAL